MIEIINNNPNTTFWLNSEQAASHITAQICNYMSFASDDFYLLTNGKRIDINSNELINDCKIYVVQRTVGGKGGFGSMLRAIGAQIEKTTNREACRDLSGRRLRDINEEKRLKNWIDQQAEREQQAADKKQKKLERLCQLPRHEFKDETYDKERSALPDKLEDALKQGLDASASTSGENKRKFQMDKDAKNKKKPKLWLDDDIEVSSSSDEDSSEKEEETAVEVEENAVAEEKTIVTAKATDITVKEMNVAVEERTVAVENAT